MTGLPRRCNLEQLLPAEHRIREAIVEVEKLGCDTRLTEVVIMLDRARNKLADYIDAEIVR